MNKTEIIQKIKQLEGLTNDERAYLVELVNTKKKYGLVWEDKPEDVEEQLRTHLPVLREVTERRIMSEPGFTGFKDSPDSKKSKPLQGSLFDNNDNLDNNDNPNNVTLSEVEAPNHILIEGDNLHALTALTFTHEGKIDVMYFDPPYNTGNKDFKYNDSFVDREDSYRHSKWLSFMNKRLRIAKRLLSEKGVVFISIDDYEFSQLKMLCDEIYNENNFVAQMIWQQGKKSSGNLIGINHEYVLVYAKNKWDIDKPDLNWKQKKQGLDKIYTKYDKIKRQFKDDYLAIEREIKSWFNSLAENDPAYGSKHYCLVDEKGLFFADNSCAPDRPETRCHKRLIHPITKKETAVPSLGWRWKEETLDKMVSEGLIYYGADESTVPKVKKYLRDMETELPTTVFYKDGRGASSELEMILGEKKFNNPKDRNEIARFLNFRPNSLILDIFAGSGTTLHATMQLNAEDGGNRQCILVTNNENNIAEEVCYERNRRVIQGYTNSKGEWVPGLTNNNLRYYKTEFVDSAKTEENRRKLTQLSGALLQIKEDCYKEVDLPETITGKQAQAFTNGTGKYLLVVYHHRRQTETAAILTEWIKQLTGVEGKIKLYAFSPETEILVNDFIEVAEKIDPVPLPDAIYNAYRNTFRTIGLHKRGKRTTVGEQSTQSNPDTNETIQNKE